MNSMSTGSAPGVASMLSARGTVQCVDLLGREITVLLSTGPEVYYVPPTCEIYLRGERIKLRIVQPRDDVRVTYEKSPRGLFAKLLEIRPYSDIACSRN